MKRLTRQALPEVFNRLNQIENEEQRRWGRLAPDALFAHLAYTVRLSLQEETDKDLSVPGLRIVLYWLFFETFPRWPGGLVKAPASFFPRPAASAAEERAECVAVLERFVDALEREPGRRTLSPLLGPISLARWSRVHAVHFEHHFRQFGV